MDCIKLKNDIIIIPNLSKKLCKKLDFHLKYGDNYRIVENFVNKKTLKKRQFKRQHSRVAKKYQEIATARQKQSEIRNIKEANKNASALTCQHLHHNNEPKELFVEIGCNVPEQAQLQMQATKEQAQKQAQLQVQEHKNKHADDINEEIKPSPTMFTIDLLETIELLKLKCEKLTELCTTMLQQC